MARAFGAGARRESVALDLAIVAIVKILVGVVVLALGFGAISDDDFARVVIAQGFAKTPRLDPSGTSWLPLPFWVTGTSMMVLGRSFEAARLVAIGSGVLSCFVVYVAARWLVDRTRVALFAALFVAVWPTTARLGVATVPELPAAALSLLAIASVATPDPRRRLVGAAAIFAACLCRYEPWFVAFGVAAYDLWDARRPRHRAVLIGAALLAVAAPVAWCAWNAHAHDGPFHFVDRVSRYKEAIDQGALGGRVLAYVLGFLRLEPEWLAFAIYFVARWYRRRDLAPAHFAAFSRPLVFSVALFVLLTASSIKGGAPTHHAERALLVLLLFGAVVLAHAAAFSWDERGRLVDPTRHLLTLAIACVVLAYPARRWVLKTDSFARRDAELRMGARAAAASDGCLVVDVVDYGHFAVEAGSGAPERWVRSRAPAPGRLLPPSAPAVLHDLARARGCGAIVAFGTGDEPAQVVYEDPPLVLLRAP